MKIKKLVLFFIALWALLTLFSCNPNNFETTDGMIITSVDQGQHSFSPGDRNIGNGEPIYRWRFQEQSKYNLNEGLDVLPWSGDQKDWNKLCGLSWSVYSNHINSAMVGWRYNPETDLFQLNSYNHVNEARQFTAPLMEIPINETFQTQVRRVVVDWTDHATVEVRIKSFSNPDTGYQGEEVSYITEYQRQDLPALTRKIATWFGGNNEAPYWIYILRSKNRIETWN